jgi:hypothetical protein
MKVQLGTGGNASTAATLKDLELEPCAEGAYLLTNRLVFDADPKSAICRFTIDGEQTTARSGDVRVLVRIRCKVPLSSYNVNGTVVTNVPEFQVHAVLTVPKVVAAAIQGTLTTVEQDSEGDPGENAQIVARNAVAQAIAMLATLLTNQPANATYVAQFLTGGSPFFKGLMGVCPVNYATADYGTVRVLPPPQRS